MGGTGTKIKFHLEPWEFLASPNHMGGWGIKNMTIFNIALFLKNLWRCLFDKGLWINVTKTKYLKNSLVSNWLRLTKFDVNGVSIVWNSFLKVLHWMKKESIGTLVMVKVSSLE